MAILSHFPSVPGQRFSILFMFTLIRTVAPLVVSNVYIDYRIYSPVNIQMDPPQIATEGFSSDSLSESSPEQHINNVEKSRRANIIFFGIIQNGC